MITSKLIVRTTTNRFFKERRYQIKIDGQNDRLIHAEDNKTEYDLPVGKHKVHIGTDESFSTKELILGTGQHKTVVINPSVTYELSVGLLLGLALTSLAVQYLILGKLSIPLMLIPCIPFFFIRKSQFANSFILTVR